MGGKIRNWLYPLTAVGLILILATSCSKDEDNNNPASITDIDGNVYTYGTIGTQVWMVENLKTTKYNDGTAIPLVTDNTEWTNLTTGAYCWYNNDIENKTLYGALYNWYTVKHDQLCPRGWHVPSLDDLKVLITYLGGTYDSIDNYRIVYPNYVGGKLKETGTIHWQSENVGATNETAFTALPGGVRWAAGFFDDFYKSMCFWIDFEIQDPYGGAMIYIRYYDASIVGDNAWAQQGASIRCIKD